MRLIPDLCRSAYTLFKVESEEGVAAVEYGLLAAMIAVVIITAVSTLRSSLSAIFTAVGNQI